MDFPFDRLPIDIQSYLFKFRPDLIPIACRVCKGFYRRIRLFYLDRIGVRSISKSELSIYLESKPDSIGYLQFIRGTFCPVHRILASWFSPHEAYSIEYLINCSGSSTESDREILELSVTRRLSRRPQLNSDLVIWGELNFFNRFAILSNRYSCLRIDPNYSRSYLLKSINRSPIGIDIIILYLHLFVFFRLLKYSLPSLPSVKEGDRDLIYSYSDMGLIGPSDRLRFNGSGRNIYQVLSVFRSHNEAYLDYLDRVL